MRRYMAWGSLGLMLALSGCGQAPMIAAVSVPLAAVPARAASVAAAPVSLASWTVSEAMATCSEIVHDRRPVGVFLVGKLQSGQSVTVAYQGTDPVSPGTSDTDVPNDSMIQHLRPVQGTYSVQVAEAGRASADRALTTAERALVLSAVNRALSANPQGLNPSGQTRRIVLACAKRILEDPRSGV